MTSPARPRCWPSRRSRWPACSPACVASVGRSASSRRRKALKPDFKRINPMSGAKNIFGPNALVETAKSLAKVGVVGAIVALALLPKLPEFGGMVGMSPADFGSILAADMVLASPSAPRSPTCSSASPTSPGRSYRTEKSLKMDKQEVKRRGQARRTSRPRSRGDDPPPPDGGARARA